MMVTIAFWQYPLYIYLLVVEFISLTFNLMIITVKFFSLFVLLALSNNVFAQTDATILVIPNLDAKVLIDGIEKGQAKASSALRITVTSGEHYVEAQTASGLTIGQVVKLESGKQEILKLNFDNTVAAPVESVAVAELNFGLPGVVTVASWQSSNEGKKYPYPEYYYAFEKGDEIILNLTMSNKNGTNIINVSTYPDGIERFSNKAFIELNDLRIKVPERSIYRFAFATNHTFDRNAFFKITRKPPSPETTNFNTKVTYRRTLTPISVIEPQNFFVNSGSNAAFMGGKSRIIVPVTLPENTVEWFYRFSASRDAADIENVKKNFGLFGEVTKLLFGLSGVGEAVNTLAIEKLSQPPGANYCDIFFIEQQFIQAFEAKADNQWQYFLEGSRENFMSGNVKVTCCNNGQYYLGIKNPDTSYGVHISMEVVAITAVDGYAMESD